MDDKLRILPVRGRRPVFLGRHVGVEGVFFVSSGAGASHALVSPAWCFTSACYTASTGTKVIWMNSHHWSSGSEENLLRADAGKPRRAVRPTISCR